MQRKGEMGDQVMMVVFLFAMIIVALGLVAGKFLFFGGEYDYREAEANTLHAILQRCIIGNNITWDRVVIDDSVFYSICAVRKDVLANNTLIRIERNNVEVLSLNRGKFEECKLTGAANNEAYPLCVESTFVKGNEKYVLLTGSTQKKVRVST